MHFSKLTDEQVLALLAEHPKMMSIPGVVLVWVDYVDSRGREIAVVATVYKGNHNEISQLPLTIAGLPVIVKVEDRQTGHVVEVIDPRRNGDTWPRSNHQAR